MLNNQTVAVLIPCYNEESQIDKVIRGLPEFVDFILVVDDGSTDATSQVVLELQTSQQFRRSTIFNLTNPNLKGYDNYRGPFIVQYNQDSKIVLLKHLKNLKKGRAIAHGYLWSLVNEISCTAIMDGDGQMDPNELKKICQPICAEGFDYVKGNRLIHELAKSEIPKIRYFGNSALSLLTKIASGYWKVSDSQTGYCAISLQGLSGLDLKGIYHDFGIPNDILVKLNVTYCRIKEVKIKPVYNVGEVSKMRIWKVIPKLSALLVRLFFYRMWNKYFFRDFHPLFLLYHMGILLGLFTFPFFYRIVEKIIDGSTITFQTLFGFTFFSVLSFQCIVFAMWMDMLDNEKLYERE